MPSIYKVDRWHFRSVIVKQIHRRNKQSLANEAKRMYKKCSGGKKK